MEARAGIEPAIEDLQSSALPLGDRALKDSQGNRLRPTTRSSVLSNEVRGKIGIVGGSAFSSLPAASMLGAVIPPARMSTRSDKTRPRPEAPKPSTRALGRFMPNLSQLRQSAKLLPDPEKWPESTYDCTLEVDEEKRTLTFKRLKLRRGSGSSFRWVFEGKVLLRNRDIGPPV